MKTITHLSQTLQTLLTETADELARSSRFVQRQRLVSGSDFVQGLVFGLMAEPDATYHQLHLAYSRRSPHPISATGFDQRFTPQAVAFLKRMVAAGLQSGLQQAMGTVFGLLKRFNGVYVLDGTRVSLPDGQQHLLTRLNLTSGEMTWEQTDQRQHDNHFALSHAPLPVGALRLADLGFFDLDTFAQLNQQGVYWLSRYKTGTRLYDETGQLLDLGQLLQSGSVDCPVWVGQQRLPARLVAQPVPPIVRQQRQNDHRHRARRKQRPISTRVLGLAGWTIYLTNILTLDFAALAALARARWQIERVFKLWKSFFRLPQSASHLPIRRQCLFWAKLLVILIAHWLMRLDKRTFPERSLWQTAQVIQSFAFSLFDALSDNTLLQCVLNDFQSTLARVSHLSKRASHPLSFQLLA